MTTWPRLSLSFLPGVAILFAIAAPNAMAVPITYTFTATCSGTIGSTPFTNAMVTVTATGDTSAIFAGVNPPYTPGFFFNPTQVSASIAGVGTANFTGSGSIAGYGALANGYVFVDQSESLVGFGIESDRTDDFSPTFATYGLSSSIGPASSVSLQFSNEATTLGALTLTTVTPGTFTAVAAGTPTIGGVPLYGTLTFTNPTGTAMATDSIPVQVTLSLAPGSATLSTDLSGNVIGLTAADINPFLDPNRPVGSDGNNATNSSLTVFYSCGPPFSFGTSGCGQMPYTGNFNTTPPTLAFPHNFNLTAGNSITDLFVTFAPTGVTVPPGTYTLAVVGVTIDVFDGSSPLAEIPVVSTSGQPSFVRIVGNANPPMPPLTITGSPSTISTTVGGSVSASFVASGGSGSYTYSVGGQPAGVTLSGASLSGTPTQAGNFTATVTVMDSNQASASASITINVLGLTTTALPPGTAGLFYAVSIGASGGIPTPGSNPLPTAVSSREWRRSVGGGSAPSYTFSATGLPVGLVMTSYGYLNGTVKTAGTYPIAVTVSSGGVSVTATLSLVIANPLPLSVSSAALPIGTVNVQYSQSLSAMGGLPPYTWSLISGAPPPGLSLNAAGIVSGTPTVPGAVSFGVQVADTAGGTATGTASLTIQPAPLIITTKSLPSGVINIDYPQQQLTVSGGVSPYTWALASGSLLPAGMALSSSGVSETPSSMRATVPMRPASTKCFWLASGRM